jgi:dTDP-glucose 4,6-dehydratase
MNRIMITGGAGFIGANAVEYFLNDEYFQPPSVVDKFTYAANPQHDALQVVRVYKSDIADTKWHYLFDKECPRILINFAAESHVDNSIVSDASREFINSNYVGVNSIIHAIRSYSTPILLVHVSTDEVLGDIPFDSEEEYDEYRPLRPNNLYSATKAAAEQLIQAIHHTHKDFDYVIVRSTNNYGPNQHFEKFIPTVIRSILENKKIPVYGSGNNIREWIWTGDFIHGIRALIDKYKEDPNKVTNQIFHFGSNLRKTNLDVVKTILKIMGKSEDLISFVDDRPGHDRKYALNCEKAKNLLGWAPTQKFDKGLKAVIEDVNRRIIQRRI